MKSLIAGIKKIISNKGEIMKGYNIVNTEEMENVEKMSFFVFEAKLNSVEMDFQNASIGLGVNQKAIDTVHEVCGYDLNERVLKKYFDRSLLAMRDIITKYTNKLKTSQYPELIKEKILTFDVLFTDTDKFTELEKNQIGFFISIEQSDVFIKFIQEQKLERQYNADIEKILHEISDGMNNIISEMLRSHAGEKTEYQTTDEMYDENCELPEKEDEKTVMGLVVTTAGSLSDVKEEYFTNNGLMSLAIRNLGEKRAKKAYGELAGSYTEIIMAFLELLEENLKEVDEQEQQKITDGKDFKILEYSLSISKDCPNGCVIASSISRKIRELSKLALGNEAGEGAIAYLLELLNKNSAKRAEKFVNENIISLLALEMNQINMNDTKIFHRDIVQ